MQRKRCISLAAVRLGVCMGVCVCVCEEIAHKNSIKIAIYVCKQRKGCQLDCFICIHIHICMYIYACVCVAGRCVNCLAVALMRLPAAGSAGRNGISSSISSSGIGIISICCWHFCYLGDWTLFFSHLFSPPRFFLSAWKSFVRGMEMICRWLLIKLMCLLITLMPHNVALLLAAAFKVGQFVSHSIGC